MVDFIKNIIGNDYISTSIMSLIPMIELKGGIVFARGVGFSFIVAFLLSFLGSTIVFIPIYFLLKPVLSLMKKLKWFNGFAVKVESYFQSKADSALEKQSKGKLGAKSREVFLKQLGVFIFVAIPLPLTGVWTGTAIAVFLNLKFKDVILPVILGNLVAGLIISVISEICIYFWSLKSVDYILYGLFALAIILLAISIIKVVKQKTEKDRG